MSVFRSRPIERCSPLALVFLLAAVGCGAPDLDLRIAVARVKAAFWLVPGKDADFVAAAVKLRHRDPIQEAAEASARGDDRLIGVAGFGLFFPRLSENEAPVVERLEPREILGAGDAGDELMFLYQSASYEFALAYNREILDRRRRR